MTFNDKFNDNINIVIEYLNENNGYEPRKQEVYKGIYPSKIITKIRSIYANGEELRDGSIKCDEYIIKKEILDKLYKINFNFKRKTSEDIFNRNLELLKEYLKICNNDWTKVTNGVIYKNFNLGEWIAKLRFNIRHGKKRTNGDIEYINNNNNRILLPKHRIDALEELGFKWDFNDCNITNKKEYLEKKRILHIKLYYVLQSCKNNIKSKKDIDKINKELIKTLH